VPEQFLHGANVVTSVEQMSGEGMPEGVTTGGFGDDGNTDCLLHRNLQRLLVDVVALHPLRMGVQRSLRGRK
jgi:hypothetical protein